MVTKLASKHSTAYHNHRRTVSADSIADAWVVNEELTSLIPPSKYPPHMRRPSGTTQDLSHVPLPDEETHQHPPVFAPEQTPALGSRAHSQGEKERGQCRQRTRHF